MHTNWNNVPLYIYIYIYIYIKLPVPVLNCTDDIKFQLVNKASFRSITKNTVQIKYLEKTERDISSFV